MTSPLADPMLEETKLPCDVQIGAITFRKGVSLATLVGAERRWQQQSQRLFELTHHGFDVAKLRETSGERAAGVIPKGGEG